MRYGSETAAAPVAAVADADPAVRIEGLGVTYRAAFERRPTLRSTLVRVGRRERVVREIKAVDDVNALDPQPDFVLFGGDLAQLGQREELDLGAQILKSVKAPVKMMVGEHDWFLDMGERWRALFRAAIFLRSQGRSFRDADERQ